MKKVKRFIAIIIILECCILILCSNILYKSFWHINTMPSATTVLIGDKIDFIKNTSDVDKLKEFVIKDFESQELLIKEKDKLVNNVIVSSAISFLIGIVLLVLSFVLIKKIKTVV